MIIMYHYACECKTGNINLHIEKTFKDVLNKYLTNYPCVTEMVVG